MLTQTQLLNRVSRYVSVCTDFKALVGRVRDERTDADATGIALPPVLTAYEFPLAGALDHVQSADQFLAMLAALEHLYACLGQEITYTGADGTQKTVHAGTALYGMVR